MEIPYFSNLKTQNTSNLEMNDSYRKISGYNITGIKDYKNKGDNFKYKKLSPLYSRFSITNALPSTHNETFDQDEKEEKLSLIRKLIKKPEKKPYEGYACFRVKPTTNYLLKKFEIKETPVIFEENKLCKIPYPLIKFISNRQTPNKSKELMKDILSAEFNNLSTQQKNDIKYKNYKRPIKITKLKCPEINSNNNNNFFRKINNYSENKNINNIKDFGFPLIEKYIKKKYKNNNDKNSLNREIYSCLSTNRPHYNNRRMKNILRRSYCGDDINLTEHSTFMNNISILKNEVAKKFESKDEKIDNILKDISLLKSNNHIMAFQS